jgi:hypothetical protein
MLGKAFYVARNSYSILVKDPKVKVLLWRPRCRWEVSSKIDVGGCEDVNWVHLCWICSSHGSSCGEYRLLGCDVIVWQKPTRLLEKYAAYKIALLASC